MAADRTARTVVVVTGAESIGIAIARRISAGKHILLADIREETAVAAAEVLADAGFTVPLRTWTFPSALRSLHWPRPPAPSAR